MVKELVSSAWDGINPKTKLTDSEEKDFMDWYLRWAMLHKQSLNPDERGHHYDYRGYWKDARPNFVGTLNSHLPDTYKTPGHPTFSVDSKYYSLAPGLAGSWNGEEFVPPQKVDLDRIRLRQRYAESTFNDRAVSKAGAKGAFQIMPKTYEQYAKKIGEGDLFDPEYNGRMRDAIWEDYYNSKTASNGTPTDAVRVAKALAMYNAGWGRVGDWLDKQKKAGVDIYGSLDWVDKMPWKETRDYVNFILNEKDTGSGRTNAEFDAAVKKYGYSDGGKIHIDPSKKGTFTAAASKHGKSVQAFASQVLANKENYSPAMVKKANFARNAAKWHADGGLLHTFDDGGDVEYYDTINPAIVSASLPDPRSGKGNQIAYNMAQRIRNGEMLLKDVPRSYQNYVEGIVAPGGSLDVSKAIVDNGVPIAAPIVGAAAAGPIASELSGVGTWLANPANQMTVGKFALPLLTGATVDQAFQKYTPYSSFGDAVIRDTGLDEVMDYAQFDPYMRGAVEFAAEGLNPGYYTGGLYGDIAKSIVGRKTTPNVKEIAREADASGLLKSGTVVEKSIAAVAPYEIEDLGGGYMLKSLMRGNPLEKQIGKNGTVNVNNIKALVGKGSKVEQAVVDKVLASEEFAGKNAIDYNKFRKAVQDELITYERKPDRGWQDYGVDRLHVNDNVEGVNQDRITAENFLSAHPELDWVTDEYGNFFRSREVSGLGKVYDDPVSWEYVSIKFPGWKDEFLARPVRTNTYTFSSPRIPQGSSKHYHANTLGHSRTYTTAEEPDVLHVMESQSDWAQSGGGSRNGIQPKEYWDEIIAEKEALLDQYKSREGEIADQFGWDAWERTGGIKSLEKQIAEAKARRADATTSWSSQMSYLGNNYTSRQIQENLRYAAEKGQKKMRYPTRETAAKIEGYSKSRSQTLQDNPELQKQYDELRDALRAEENRIVKKYAPKDYLDESLWEADFGDMGLSEEETERLLDQIRRSEQFERTADGAKMREEIIKAREKMDPDKWLRENVKEVYLPQHETILKKYDAFPKQYQKLFKGADVRTVTDAKGNTWYEVDVPQDYLKQEWQFANGGLINKMESTHNVNKAELLKAVRAEMVRRATSSQDV